MTSKQTTYLVAGSVIGGAIGYLFLTDSGRRAMRSIRDFDPNTIPEKLENVRGAIERGGRDINQRVETIRHRVLDSFEAARNAYTTSEANVESQLQRMEACNEKVAGQLHRAIDELNKTAYSFEKSLLVTVYETVSLVQAVKQGVSTLKSGPTALEAPQATGIR